MADVYDMSDEELEQAFLAAKEEMEAAGDEPTEEPEADLDEIDVQEDEEIDVEEEEQPDEDEDSDDDTSVDDEVEDEDSEDSDSEDSNLDEDTEEDDEKTEEDDDDAEEETQPVAKHKFKANGVDYEFTQEEMLANYGKLFGQAMDYTKKMQTIKPYRKIIDAFEQEKLSQDDLNLMIDARKGDKAALAEVLKQAGVDALELDTDENEGYVPKDYGRDDKTLDLEEVIKDISADPEYETTHKILAKEWDDSSWKAMSDDPKMIRLLHTDVKNGMYEKLMPTVGRLKVYDGDSKTDLEYYKLAAQMYYDNEAQQTNMKEQEAQARAKAEAEQAKANKVAAVEKKAAKAAATKKAAAKRKAATPTKRGPSASNVGDLLDEISDEDYEEWYAKVQERS